MGWAGFNCSIPHKVAVIEHIKELGKSAEIIGAANTMIRQNDGFIGENTDGQGFVGLIGATTELLGKHVVVFGAGVAARAVAVELALAGVADILVVNRTEQRGRKLATLLNEKTPAASEYTKWSGAFALSRETDIVVNATSVGLYPDIDARLDINWASLSDHMIVADGIHNPPETHLIRTARNRGCTALVD